MNRNENINIRGLKCHELGAFLDKFIHFGKFAGVKVSMNIMSVKGYVFLNHELRNVEFIL